MANRKLGALLALIGFFGVALPATNAGAAVGETVAQLIGRYGEPENVLGLAFGIGEWKREQGVVYAFLEDGKAVLMGYDGVDEKTKGTLLEQNLPRGQKWIDGKDVKAFMLTTSADPRRIGQTRFWQTKDGKIWAGYNPSDRSLIVATQEGLKKVTSILQSHDGKGY